MVPLWGVPPTSAGAGADAVGPGIATRHGGETRSGAVRVESGRSRTIRIRAVCHPDLAGCGQIRRTRSLPRSRPGTTAVPRGRRCAVRGGRRTGPGPSVGNIPGRPPRRNRGRYTGAAEGKKPPKGRTRVRCVRTPIGSAVRRSEKRFPGGNTGTPGAPRHPFAEKEIRPVLEGGDAAGSPLRGPGGRPTRGGSPRSCRVRAPTAGRQRPPGPWGSGGELGSGRRGGVFGLRGARAGAAPPEGGFGGSPFLFPRLSCALFFPALARLETPAAVFADGFFVRPWFAPMGIVFLLCQKRGGWRVMRIG